MKKIVINNFKAFKSENSLNVNVDGTRKNLLLFGENGAGKSSYYEAIKLVFFREKLTSQFNNLTPEEKQSEIAAFLAEEYNNRINQTDFTITINDTIYSSFDKSNYQVFMLNSRTKVNHSKIKVLELINNNYFSNSSHLDFNTFNQIKESLQKEVNNSLNILREDITIEFEDENTDFEVKLIDSRRNLIRKSELGKYFNEAKLNIIELLLIFHYILAIKDDSKSKILVLDDLITSLDTSNRMFIVKFLIDKFSCFQIITLTHSISFFNLLMKVIKADKKESMWLFANLYEINREHKLFMKQEIVVKKLKETLDNLDQNDQSALESLGNKVRKRFEIILYEYSKLFSIGAVEDSSKIIDRILYDKPVFYKNKKNNSDLLDEIRTIVSNAQMTNLRSQLNAKFQEFTIDGLKSFKEIVRDLNFYQKVSLHPLSHGNSGQTVFSLKELENSIFILEILETRLKGLVDEDTSAI